MMLLYANDGDLFLALPDYELRGLLVTVALLAGGAWECQLAAA